MSEEADMVKTESLTDAVVHKNLVEFMTFPCRVDINKIKINAYLCVYILR